MLLSPSLHPKASSPPQRASKLNHDYATWKPLSYPFLPPISHLYCDRVKVSASHIRIGKPAQRSDPSESDSRCAERGWEARHRLVSQVGASSRLTSTPTPARPLLCAPPQQCWQATQSRNRKAIWCLFGTVHRQDEMYMCVSAVMSAWMFVSVCVWCVCHQCV